MEDIFGGRRLCGDCAPCTQTLRIRAPEEPARLATWLLQPLLGSRTQHYVRLRKYSLV
jgi:hypothetical protein